MESGQNMGEAAPPPARHIVLSLDLGSDTGWCIGENNIIKHSGVTTFKSPGAHPGLKFTRFANWLVQFKNVSEIFYEETPMYASLTHARVNCGMLAILQRFSVEANVPITFLFSTSIKKIFTGSGKAGKDIHKKQPMCDAAHNLGWMGGKRGTTMCHDEADAIAIYFSIMQRRGQQVMFENTDPAIHSKWVEEEIEKKKEMKKSIKETKPAAKHLHEPAETDPLLLEVPF